MSDASHRDVSHAAPIMAAPVTDTKRRRFLLAFGAGAASAASTSALAASPAAIVPPAQSVPVSQGYQETDHVRKYYASTRL